MNTNQYTQKTLEALQAAQQLAVEYQHNALEPEHLLHALATQEQGLIPQLLQKLNVDAGSFSAAVAEKLSAMPRVSGSGRDPDKVYISQATDKVLSAAAREAKAMKDDYVSVEHVFLALLDEQTQNTSELFRAFGITKDKFLQQLTAVRGNQRVTNDNPEDTPTMPSRSTVRIWSIWPASRSWTPSSAAIRRSGTSSASCPVRPRTTPASSVSRASARRPSPRVWPSVSSGAMCPRT